MEASSVGFAFSVCCRWAAFEHRQSCMPAALRVAGGVPQVSLCGCLGVLLGKEARWVFPICNESRRDMVPDLQKDEGVEHQGVGADVPFFLFLGALIFSPLHQSMEVLHAVACCLARRLILILFFSSPALHVGCAVVAADGGVARGCDTPRAEVGLCHGLPALNRASGAYLG